MATKPTGNEIREIFLNFMKERGHTIIPGAALIPENDPSTLFTGSGMQPLVPYLLGEVHPKGNRLADSQRCFRADDIEEVGDNRHTTLFEMLGNWSLGDYFKKEQLGALFELLTTKLGLDPSKLYVTTFLGNEEMNLPRDEESVEIWTNLFKQKGMSSGVGIMGSEKEGGERGMRSGERIFYYDSSKNWWSRVGRPEKMPVGEIGGPDSEIFYDFGTSHDKKFGEECHPNCDCGRFIEIGNSVFMQYIRKESGFELLPQKNVDFGGGLERITAAILNDADVFKTDLFAPIIAHIETLSGKKYNEQTFAFRVIADHLKGAVFMIGDDIFPANTEQGYFTRRLLRRAVRYADSLHIPSGSFATLATSVIDIYKAHYPHLQEKQHKIGDVISQEETQFRKTLGEGMKQFEKIALKVTLPSKPTPEGDFTVPLKLSNRTVYTTPQGTTTATKEVSGKAAFNLFTTYGFPIELTKEIAQEKGYAVDLDEFNRLMTQHRALSRQGAEQKFRGGLADQSDKVVAYHTATHLLLAGLRKELGSDVHQAGSNITGERLRFDFTYPTKVSDDVLRKVETYVNNAIKNDAKVSIETMSKDDAQNDPTVEGSFWDRYPDTVKIYTVKSVDGTVYSRELCGGPHVEKTSALSGTFRIIKEESSSHGVRRIKAILE